MTVNAHAVPNVVSQNENSMKSRSEINMDHDIKLATSDFQEFLLVLYHDMKYGEGGNGLVSKLKNSFRKAKNFIIGGIAGVMLYSGSARADFIWLRLSPYAGPPYLGGEEMSLAHLEGGEEGYDPGDGLGWGERVPGSPNYILRPWSDQFRIYYGWPDSYPLRIDNRPTNSTTSFPILADVRKYVQVDEDNYYYTTSDIPITAQNVRFRMQPVVGPDPGRELYHWTLTLNTFPVNGNTNALSWTDGYQGNTRSGTFDLTQYQGGWYDLPGFNINEGIYDRIPIELTVTPYGRPWLGVTDVHAAGTGQVVRVTVEGLPSGVVYRVQRSWDLQEWEEAMETVSSNATNEIELDVEGYREHGFFRVRSQY